MDKVPYHPPNVAVVRERARIRAHPSKHQHLQRLANKRAAMHDLERELRGLSVKQRTVGLTAPEVARVRVARRLLDDVNDAIFVARKHLKEHI